MIVNEWMIDAFLNNDGDPLRLVAFHENDVSLRFLSRSFLRCLFFEGTSHALLILPFRITFPFLGLVHYLFSLDPKWLQMKYYNAVLLCIGNTGKLTSEALLGSIAIPELPSLLFAAINIM